MAKSLIFEMPQEDALDEFKKHLFSIDIKITKEQEINKGIGVKLSGLYQNQPVSYVLYFNRSKCQSSKIVIEKSTPEINEQLNQFIGNNVTNKSSLTKIPVHSSLTVTDASLYSLIKESLTAAGYLNKEYPEQDHIEYMLKLSFQADELTLTLFKTGKLLLQGVYTNLFDEVVSIIDSINPLSDEDRALLLVPKREREKISNDFKINTETTQKFAQKSQTEAGNYFDFLFENDQKGFRTGDMLTKIIQESDQDLPEYNFLVAIFSKVFEGFIIKLLINKDFFTLDQYRKKPEISDIGNVLRKKKLEKYIKDPRRFGYITEQLIAVWEGARCKEMHSDPVADQKIITISSLNEAIEKIGGIKSCMKEAYGIIVLSGYDDSDLTNPIPTQETPKASGTSQKSEIAEFKTYIGTDESGKGDYLGPLVIAGVYVDEVSSQQLLSAGVRDSKKISDGRIIKLAKTIKEIIKNEHFSVIIIGPEKYNQLYEKIGNLNSLLAWGHSRAIENILSKTSCDTAVADQFGDEEFINRALMEKGKKIKMIQMPKAEKHIAVAAASILARESFLKYISGLSNDFKIQIPKGASQQVVDTCKTLIMSHGSNILNKIAKVHFKTTQKIV
jgi:ribonuclease HIII